MRLLSSILAAFLILSPVSAFAQAAPTYADCSIASMSGSSQALGTAFALGSRVYSRKYLLVCNNSVAGDNLGVNFAGGTANLTGAGTVVLVPGSCKEFSAAAGGSLPIPPSNNVNVIGTSGQPVLCYEGR